LTADFNILFGLEGRFPLRPLCFEGKGVKNNNYLVILHKNKVGYLASFERLFK
jgi:hypothetical protein